MSVLERILASVGERVAQARRERPEAAMRREAEAAGHAPPFSAALDQPGTSLVAEFKRRSPSCPDGFGSARDPARTARDYAGAGARAVSVVTERDHFGGSGEDLRAVRATCSLPILRKDFLVDPYQCWEARAWGASAALLITGALEDSALRDLAVLLGELGMDALVEVHTEEEAERALALPDVILGVNNRDLRTFRTDRDATARIARLVSGGRLLVSESGISTREHVLEVERAGASAVLVGEALLTSGDPAAKARELLGATP